MAESNHRAEVVPVVLEPHPNADRLSIVRVKAYTCVVATKDWEGVTKAVYIQPDTVVPDKPEFAFLKRMNSARAELEKELQTGLTPEEHATRLGDIEAREVANTKALRITAKKLRGVQSFGMLWPAPTDAQIGDNLWDEMNFQRYDPPLPVSSGGEFENAPDLPWVYNYDVENYYNFPDVLQEGEQVVATEKIHGANARYVYAKSRETGEYRMFCGSRTAWMRQSITNLYWSALRVNPWIEEFCRANPECTLYGEVFGNVQSLKYGVKQNQPNRVRVFDVLAINAFLDYGVFESMFSEEKRVPVIYLGSFNADRLKALSVGKSTLADHLREGIVVKPVRERNDMTVGRVILKMVSPEYLEKGK